MELDRREVPLYGQVEARATLQVLDADEQAEFYVVLEGSRLTHVTVARRVENGASLSFMVPGHDLPEAVSVSFYCHTRGLARPCDGSASLKYIHDAAQEVVEYLVTNSDHLNHQSYQEVLRIISQEGGVKNRTAGPGGEACPGQGHQEEGPVVGECSPEQEVALREMDERITLAIANMDHPPLWGSVGTQPREGQADLRPRETLLHLAVRLGLPHFSRFLIRQPRGQRALTFPNSEGDTPLQLAQRRKHHGLFRALAIPPVSTAAPPIGVSCVWSDSIRALLFCPRSDSLTLTAQRAAAASVLDGVEFLRDRMTEQDITRKIAELRGEAQLNHRGREELLHSTMRNKDQSSHADGAGKLQLDQCVVDNVFEEELVLSLDDDEEEFQPSIRIKGQTASAVCMTNGASRVRLESAPLTQGNDADGMYSVAGVTRSSSGTDSRAWDTVHTESLLQATDTPPPPPDLQSDDARSLAALTPAAPLLLPSTSSADQALARLKRISHADLASHAEAASAEACDLSPSLVALELDSEDGEGDTLGMTSPLPHLSLDPRSSGDEREAFDPSPDLACIRSHSTSSAGEATASKDVVDPGVRLRSYSYSSPKISLRPAHLTRDHASPSSSSNSAADGVFHNLCHSRSLLQALSLSKSLSLLHPGKQRASSLTDPLQDKREPKFRKRAQSADDEGSAELAESLQHLTLSEFLKEIEEEEWDNYSIPSKVESEKYKVIRTFSFLKSRMSSTRSKNKGKGKEKEREGKDRPLNGHRFSSGSCAGPTLCLVCDKPASGKDLLHCASCTVMVHKGCKESAPPCLKKLQDKYAVTTVKSRAASLPQNFTVRDSLSPPALPTSASVPVMSPKERRETTSGSLPSALSRSIPSATDRLSESLELENDGWRMSGQSEELLQTTESSTSTDSSLGEDCVDACLHNDLAADALDYEAESWSLTVEHKFCKKQDKRVVKRQDVIYELMQTELHHLQTLCVMAEVFRRGMREEVLLDAEAVGRVFPCLDELLLFHHGFFSAMRERRCNSAYPHGHGNYLIQHIGDILRQQFCEENAERMKQVYGDFCSHHNEAVSFFKELQQQNKRFQHFIKQQSINSLARRREIPECILLVTQRITKYPVLLERILQYTQEDTEEHTDLSQALAGIREVIATVDLRVSEYEQNQRLQEVLGRIENRSSAKLKNGSTFRKQDVLGPGRTLRHQGVLLWKTATGRLKDVLALLLTDIIIFLQEKDQKYIFAAVDQKPPVISLQKLIVREVANEERGMFLISASTAGPEMYEVHTSSKEERNTWMRLVREAVESCPEEEEETTSESEEEKRAAEARVQKITKLQESLGSQDQQICSSLEEKLQVYAQLSALCARGAEPHPKPRLLVQPHPEEVPQAAVLLTAALREAEHLRATLTSRTCSPSSPVGDPEAEPPSLGSSPSSAPGPSSDPELSPGEAEVRDVGWTDSEVLLLQSLPLLQTPDAANINLKVAQSVQSLTQLLYSLQAAVTIQDSCYEVQRLLLREAQRSSPRSTGTPHLPCLRAGALQEQEKQRNLEKRREEAAAAARLQGRLRQERLRWERECQARQSRQGELESRLEEREGLCLLEAARLRQERAELQEQLEEYQQGLERLREGQRSVEREREKLETQQKLLQSWRHSRQRSLPVMVIPLDGPQDCPPPGQPGGNLDDGSVFVNEAAFSSATLNNRHRCHVPRGYVDDASAHNSLNSLLARSGHRQSSLAKPPQSHTEPSGWARGAGHLYSPLARPETEVTHNDVNTHRCGREAWSSTPTGADHFPGPPADGDPQLDLTSLVSMETDSVDEEGVEENIVYL